MIETVVNLFNSKALKLEESEILVKGKSYWLSNVVTSERVPLSSGFGESKSLARRIAVSEAVERAEVLRLMESSHKTKSEWGLVDYPTACGFAVGYDMGATVERSVGEAAERWVMSQWIDKGFYLKPLELRDIEVYLDDASRFLVEQFDRVLFFVRNVEVTLEGRVSCFVVVQTMGLKGDGIFPGSSARLLEVGPNWQHALVESLRHLLAVRNNPSSCHAKFPGNRVEYFSRHASEGLAFIERATKAKWPKAKISLIRKKKMCCGDFFIARTIFDGWESWVNGPINRFVF